MTLRVASRQGTCLFLLGACQLLLGCGDGGSDSEPVALKSGDITTFAGTGVQGNSGDGHPLTKSDLNQPMEVVFSKADKPYIVDWNNHSIRSTDADGNIVTLIGQALPGDWPCQNPTDPSKCDVALDGAVAATDLRLNHPLDLIAMDDDSLLYAAWHNHKLQHCDGATQMVTNLAGQQAPGFVGDAGPATAARLNFPASIALDSTGALLIADERNQRIRRIDTDGNIATVAGGVMMGAGFIGDGVPALQAQFALAPYNEAGGSDNPPPGGGIVLDADGDLFVADTYNNCIRKIDAGSDGVLGTGTLSEEIVTTVAGSCGLDTAGYSGDGEDALAATFRAPFDLELGPDGALYIADADNNVVRRVDLAEQVVTTVAGTGAPGFSGDGGPATEAKLRRPYGIAFDSGGNLYIVDTVNNRIRRVKK